MSRRATLTPRQAQYRAASRMTVGTKMWAEQPVPEDRPRFILPQGADEGPLLPPESMRFIDAVLDIGGGTPGAAIYVTLAAGEQTILIVATSPGQGLAIASGWEVLASTTIGGNESYMVTRVSPSAETSLVATTGPETHPFNVLQAQGFAFLSESVYTFTPRKKGEQAGNPVTFHAWGGFPTTFRMRALTLRGSWTGWDTPGDNGHNDLSFLSPRTSWWNPGGISTPETYLTSTWPAGVWYSSSLGLAGPVTWTEWHIKVGRS